MKRFCPFPFLIFLLQLLAFWTQTLVAQAQNCPAPIAYNNSENYSVNSGYLQWDGGSQNGQFTLEIRTTRETSWSSIAPITSNWYSVTGLTPSTNYVWRVKTDCSPFSNTATVSTGFCGTYNLQIIPLSTSAELKWRSALNTTYNLKWREQGGDWTTVSGLTGMITPATSIPRFYLSSSYSLTGLTPNSTYEWQLEALCGAGYNAVSQSSTFTAVCYTPVALSANNVQATSTNVIWQTIYGGSITSEIRPLESANASWAAIEGSALYNYFANPPYWLKNITGLIADTGYEVRVRANCQDGTSSAFTKPFVFFTLGPPCHTSMDTIRPGLWTDPTIWSCGRVPVPSDLVYVMHDVLIPDNAIGRVRRVFYGFGGQVRLGTGARLLLSR